VPGVTISSCASETATSTWTSYGRSERINCERQPGAAHHDYVSAHIDGHNPLRRSPQEVLYWFD
jgi:hypothetical protein